MTAVAQDELVVFSHLRWSWVWQRPQHLISRLARRRPTWFVEEPMPAEIDEPTVRTERCGEITRVWLEVPSERDHVGYDDPSAELYAELLPELLGLHDCRTAWLYTPLALPVARAVDPTVLVYDVMDDLASFAHAPANLVLRQRQALVDSDVVFCGGRSLHASVLRHRPEATYLFASGVEPDHYAAAIPSRTRHDPCVAGYVGVIDERLDLELVAEVARHLSDWEIQMVGPVAKIDPATLPQADNIRYLGKRSYEELPATMAGFDVALMPFALNEATRSISPTKTLEYLAAGLPVVSTRVPDVVADYGNLVDLQDTSTGFADACRKVAEDSAKDRAEKARPLLHRHHWDTIASRMDLLVAEVYAGRDADEETA